MQSSSLVSGSIASVRSRAAVQRTTTDEALVEAICDHNEGAMEVLFARHHVRVYRFVLRIVGNAALAEDLTSEVFITVWRHASQFKKRSTVSTWLLAIARYKALAELRRKSRLEARCNGQTAAEECSQDTPESELQAGDRRRIVRKCLAHLSREHRAIVDLVYYHEKSVNEIAEILNIPSNTVKTRMYYARRKLAELLEGEGLGAP